MSKILHLTLKRHWFDMIDAGIKPEEYREIKPYWFDRFVENASPSYDMWEEPGCYEEAIYSLKNHLKGYVDLNEWLEFNQLKFKHFDQVLFRNGYSSNAPKMLFEFNGFSVGTGNEDWGGKHADGCEFSFILKLGTRVKNG